MDGVRYAAKHGKQVVSDNKSALFHSSLLLYIAGYLLLSAGGLSFQAQPALAGYHIAPLTPTNPQPSDGATVTVSDVPINVSVTDDDGQDLDVTFWNDATDTAIDTATSVPSGSRAAITWTSLTDGSYTWKAHACESNGGANGVDCSSNSSVWTLTVDTTPPTAAVTHSPAIVSDTDQVTYNATATDATTGVNTIELWVDGSLVQTCNSSPCTYTEGPYSQGSVHPYNTTVTDNAGNTNNDSGSVTVNSAPLPPDLPEPLDGQTVTTLFTNLSAHYDDPDGDAGTLRYYNRSDNVLIGSCSVTDGGRCNVNWTGLSIGSHDWYATAEDTAGYTTRSSNWTFTVDPTYAPLDELDRLIVPNQNQTITLGLGAERVIPLRLNNPDKLSDIYTISLQTSPTEIVSAEIISGDNLAPESAQIEMDPESSRYIRIRLVGTSCLGGACSATVTVTGISSRTDERFIESLDVVVNRDQNVHGAPGITLLQLLVIGLFAALIAGRRY